MLKMEIVLLLSSFLISDNEKFGYFSYVRYDWGHDPFVFYQLRSAKWAV